MTGYGELMLAEFKYGPEPKETFGNLPFIGDQAVPRRYVSDVTIIRRPLLIEYLEASSTTSRKISSRGRTGDLCSRAIGMAPLV